MHKFVHERAIRALVGSPAVMQEQTQYLLLMSSMPQYEQMAA
ncbi:Scr1 family TA system antitoxin-like transcriptional regulator [Amycolatopsis sp. H20-H5]|nr:Scr1 family TA system antitoxin-like transcriptional regulator [Amycolatopsis sp. H20-H5]MEC3974159.1 Scr1 family TA system antitoxin-like transcriptional regulator [Amycolatopsis sp. H20-H5]